MKKECVSGNNCTFIVAGLLCMSLLAGCTEGALYATQMAIGKLQYAGAAASIANNISESDKKKAEEHYKKATSYYNNKQYAMAEESINESIKLWNDHNDYHVLLGQIYFKMYFDKDNDDTYLVKAHDKFKHVLDNGNEKNSKILSIMSRISRLMGNYDDAVQYAERAINIDGRQGELLCDLGAAKLSQDKYSESAALLRESLPKLNESTERGQIAHVNFMLGYISLTKDESIDDAKKYLDKSLSYFPEHGKYVTNAYAWFYATAKSDKLRNPKKSLELMESIKNEKREYYFLNTLAAAHAENGDFEKAVMNKQESCTMKKTGDNKDCEDVLNYYKSGKTYAKYKLEKKDKIN